MTPLFSILIANYNNGKYIAECLDSVLNQDYPNIEIILVDDSSTDESLAIIQPYLKKYPNLKLFKNEINLGVGYTKKRCIDEANGVFLGIVDADDKIELHAVSAMAAKHVAQPNASLIYSNLYYCDEDFKITGLKKINQVPLNLPDFFNQADDISHFATFKKAAYLMTNGINTSLKTAEDQDLYLKLYDVGTVLLLDEPLYHYRIHSGGLSTLNNEDSSFFDRWKVIFQRAEEKGIDIEDYFLQTFVRKERVKHWLKLDYWMRNSFIYKIYKRLR